MALDTQETVLARVEPRVKAEAEAILAELGITPEELIRHLYAVIIARRAVPIEFEYPNAETRAAIKEIDRGVGLKSYANAEEMFRELGL